MHTLSILKFSFSIPLHKHRIPAWRDRSHAFAPESSAGSMASGALPRETSLTLPGTAQLLTGIAGFAVAFARLMTKVLLQLFKPHFQFSVLGFEFLNSGL
jgi:hypothetical protein